jgi:hypothetical protein
MASSTQNGFAPRFMNISQELTAMAASETTQIKASGPGSLAGTEPAGSRSWLDRNHAVAVWLLCGIFFAVSAPRLPYLQPNFDEGVYLVQAQLVRQGNVPYVDFFCHQPPLYLYALAPFAVPGPDSVTFGRLLSLLATGACGVLVAKAGRRLAGSTAAVLGQLAFYGAPLQIYGMLALPNALMVLLSAAGVFAVLLSERTRSTVAGGVLLTAAVLVKPLAMPVALATVLLVAAFRSERRKLPALVLSGLFAGLAAWLALHAASQGAFTEVLSLQARRYSGRSGFELMAHYVDFRTAMIERGAATPTLWNLSEHRAAFLKGGLLNGNLLLLIAAGASPFFWRRSMPQPLLAMACAWLFLTVVFSVLVWEPNWDHYYVQYLPPLSLLAGITLAAAVRARRLVWRIAAIPLLAGCLVLGPTQRWVAPNWYRRAAEIGRRARGAAVFSFNPLINAVNGTRHVCGMVDPLNVYGEYGVAALAPEGPLGRFRITPDRLIACLTPDVRVVIDSYAFWFLEPRVVAHLQASRHRLDFFTGLDRRRFEALPPSNH